MATGRRGFLQLVVAGAAALASAAKLTPLLPSAPAEAAPVLTPAAPVPLAVNRRAMTVTSLEVTWPRRGIFEDGSTVIGCPELTLYATVDPTDDSWLVDFYNGAAFPVRCDVGGHEWQFSGCITEIHHVSYTGDVIRSLTIESTGPIVSRSLTDHGMGGHTKGS